MGAFIKPKGPDKSLIAEQRRVAEEQRKQIEEQRAANKEREREAKLVADRERGRRTASQAAALSRQRGRLSLIAGSELGSQGQLG